MYDYEGDMEFYQKQLTAVGIPQERFDMDNYVGLTARELQGIVDSVIAQKDKYMKEGEKSNG